MLDISRLREQFDGFTSYQAGRQQQTGQKLQRALEALDTCDADWRAAALRVRQANVRKLVAELLDAPGETFECGPRPTPITVVASDGSQIYPDRHVEPTCYLLNISRVVFQYGTLERPLMESAPMFRYRKDDLEAHFDPVDLERVAEALFERATSEVVSALRDQFELEALLDAAKEARVPGRPIVAIADGTLIRWMLSGLGNRILEDQLIGKYVATLAQFREAEIPVCSYISMPRNTEVVNFLEASLNHDETGSPDSMEPLAGLTDRTLFEATLPVGRRSAVFQASSHNQKEYGEVDRICYFYVHVGSRTGRSEVARIEIPKWIAGDGALVDTLHALVLNECEKGDGYPVILSEAHEQAVIRARERELFYAMIETEMHTAGLPFNGSRKQASKRRPVV